MGDFDEDGGLGPGLNDEVAALFATKRHGTDLPSKLIKVIVSYYMDVLEIDSIEEVEHDAERDGRGCEGCLRLGHGQGTTRSVHLSCAQVGRCDNLQ